MAEETISIKYVILIVVVIIGAVSLFAVFSGNFLFKTSNAVSSQQVAVGTEEGQKAPDFTVTTIDGETSTLSELNKAGAPVFLYFSATWCPLCTAELRQLNRVYDEYKNRIVFLYMSIDPKVNVQIISDYKQENGFPFDFAQSDRDVLITYKAIQLGTKYGINKDGIIVFKEIRRGGLDDNGWRNVFNRLLS